MIPKVTQIDTDQVSGGLKPVETDEAKPSKDRPSLLRPELQKAVDESWERNQEAYRYLGR